MTTKNAETNAKKTSTKHTPAKKATPKGTTKPATATNAITSVKKGDLYETKGGTILEVANGRLKDEGEQGASFAAREIVFHAKTLQAEPQKATDRYYLDELVRKLSKKDYEEWIEGNRRETETAAVDAASQPDTTTDRPAPKPKPTKRNDKNGKLTAIDAAARVLAEAGEGMRCKDLIEQMEVKGYWKSPGGKTPHATLYSAILREINTKSAEARFVKLERGLFAAKK